MKPTPGPWELDLEACQIGIPVPQSDKNYGSAWIDLHDSYDWYPDIPTEVLEANARLIAAAPELLAALIETYHIIRNCVVDVSNSPLSTQQKLLHLERSLIALTDKVIQ